MAKISHLKIKNIINATLKLGKISDLQPKTNPSAHYLFSLLLFKIFTQPFRTPRINSKIDGAREGLIVYQIVNIALCAPNRKLFDKQLQAFSTASRDQESQERCNRRNSPRNRCRPARRQRRRRSRPQGETTKRKVETSARPPSPT